MAAYTIEDVELLRRKGGMTYQEAVALLEYHDGNLARALIDLEKNGRLKDETAANRSTAKTAASGSAQKHAEVKEKALNLLQKLYRCRAKVHKGNVTVVNLSVLYAGACLLFAPHITIAGIIIAMILGYRFSFSQMDENFATVDLKKPVKTAEKAAETSEAEPVAPSAVDLSKELNEQVEALTEKEIPTIQVPAQATC